MVSFSTSEWVFVGLVLLLGWVLGLMSRSGGGKWKRELRAERERHAAVLAERDARIAEHDKRIAEYDRARPTVVTREVPLRDPDVREVEYRDRRPL